MYLILFPKKKIQIKRSYFDFPYKRYLRLISEKYKTFIFRKLMTTIDRLNTNLKSINIPNANFKFLFHDFIDALLPSYKKVFYDPAHMDFNK